jgi:PleD family two-component response regulator
MQADPMHPEMKQAPDEIAIVTQTPSRAERLKQTFTLRGFDEISCFTPESALAAFEHKLPALVIVDMEGNNTQPVEFLKALSTRLKSAGLKSTDLKSIVLADAFDENLFLACHDCGAKDFLVQPVPEAMLISRVIRNLQDHRLEQVARQKDGILVEMGVLSEQSGVFSTSYLISLLRRHVEAATTQAAYPLSLLILKIGGYPTATSPESLSPETRENLLSTVGGIVKDCARGLDMVGELFMDKFAVIMPQTGRRGATALGKRIQQRLQDQIPSVGHSWRLTVEFGIAEAGETQEFRHYETLLNEALEDLNQPLAANAPPSPSKFLFESNG